MNLWAILPGALLISATYLTVAERADAAWATHGVVGWDTRTSKYPVAWDWSDDKSRVKVFLPVRENMASFGYFVITTKERFPKDKLDFRMSMSRWRNFQESLERTKNHPSIAERISYEMRNPEGLSHHLRALYEDVQRFEEMHRVEPQTRGGVHGIFLELDKEVALRTYLVYDFLPWGGSHIRDGGLWLTYDLPSFLEMEDEKSSNALPISGAQLRIKDLSVEEAPDGTRTFRAQIEKLSKDLEGRWAVRFRIWQRRPDGTLVLSKPINRPELDATILPKWKQFESRDIVLSWEGPDEESGNEYYGCSVDALCGNRIQDSHATSADLLVHLLSVESLDTNEPNSAELSCGVRPERIWHAAKVELKRINENLQTTKPDSIRQELDNVIETLEMLEKEFPEWSSGDPAYGNIAGEVTFMLRDARKLRDDL